MKRMMISGLVNGTVWGFITGSLEVAAHMAVLGILVVELARMMYYSVLN